MKITIEKKLTDQGKAIREEVFLKEQGFSTEFDDIDDFCWHLLMTDGDKGAVAVARMFNGDEVGEYIFGRVAVRKDCRGKKYGNLIMEALENKVKELHGTKISLDAQCHAQKFYEKLGYKAHGQIHYDEHCPHIAMTKTL